MHAEVKTWVREGFVFSNNGYEKRGDYVQIDLSDFRVLHVGVDTFKQLFHGVCNTSMLSILEGHYSSMPDIPITIGSFEFKLSRSSSTSGFSFVLRNLYYGVVVLFKSFYAEADKVGTHLKIEYSPHRLLTSNPSDIDQCSLDIASMFLDGEFFFSDVAVHIACDFKGFDIPDNLEKNLRTKAKRNYSFSGIDSVSFDLQSAVAKYGSNESYTFGSPGAIQMCLYDKIKEAVKRDKLDFWVSQVWSKTPSVDDPFLAEYKSDDKVSRLEARFHHSVIRQFCKGTNTFEAVNFSELVPHLTGLWRYFLDNFRFHFNKNFIHPVWQILMDDVVVHGPCKPLIYRRDYKSEGGSSRRNVAFWIGNALRLFARQQFETAFIVKYFLDSGLLAELKDYFCIPPNSTVEELSMVAHEFIHKRMRDHFLNGVAV